MIRTSRYHPGYASSIPNKKLTRRRLSVGRIALRAAWLAPRPSRHHRLIRAASEPKGPSRQPAEMVVFRAALTDAGARCRAACLASKSVVAFCVRSEPERPDCPISGCTQILGEPARNRVVFISRRHPKGVVRSSLEKRQAALEHKARSVMSDHVPPSLPSRAHRPS